MKHAYETQIEIQTDKKKWTKSIKEINKFKQIIVHSYDTE